MTIKHLIRRSLTGGLVIAAAGYPTAAHGRPLLDTPIPRSATPAAPAPTVIHVAAPTGGFDWGDAGIGAAGGLAISMLGVGGALMISQRRVRRSSKPTAITG
jgi:hypothetical protein